jgi:glyoxylase-like metal-dependent hydrolase (beta-lactamase superfamily II)
MLRRALMLGTGALALPASLSSGDAAAQPAAPAGFFGTRVGALEVTVLHDGTAPRADVRENFVSNAPGEAIADVLAAQGLQPTDLPNTFSPTLVRTGRDLVLIDTGRGGQAGRLLGNLRASGVEPAQVTLVLLTHLHGDHIGGMVDAAGVPVFPNARVTAPARELAFWTDAGEESRAAANRRANFPLARRNLGAYGERVAGFAPGAEVAPGIRALASTGHSPGHSSFVLSDGAQQLIVLGDVIGAPQLFLPMPAWQPLTDMDAAQAVATRLAMLDRVATDRIAVIAYHWPMPATGRVERAGTGYRFVPANA